MTFRDPGFAEIFQTLCEATDSGRLVVTSRYRPPGSDAFLLEIAIPPLSAAEQQRLMLRLPALRDLDASQRRVVRDTIGGHPRLIEFVNALMRSGRGNLKDVTIKLRALTGDTAAAVQGARPLTQAISEAVLLGSRDILLNELVGVLSDEERELLLQAAVSTVPQTISDLAVAVGRREPSVEEQTPARRGVERLLDLTLLSVTNGGDIVVHPWIAEALHARQGPDLALRHERAAQMRLARFEAGRGVFADLIEICRHHAGAGHDDQLVSYATAATTMIESQLGELSVGAFLGEVVPMIPADTDGYGWLADRESQALRNTGSVTAALTRASALLGTTKQRAEADPGNAQAQRDLSVSYNKLGDLALLVGDGAQAERYHRDALAIAQRLAEADSGNAQAQRDLSVCYERLGDLALRVGDGAQAERYYRDALAIRERLAEADPGNFGQPRFRGSPRWAASNACLEKPCRLRRSPFRASSSRSSGSVRGS